MINFNIISKAEALTLTMPHHFEFNDAANMPLRELEAEMISTTDKNIDIIYNGLGGSMEESMLFVEKMKIAQKQGKKVKLIITDGIASAHSLAACFADEIVLKRDAVLNFHYPYSVTLLNGNAVIPKQADKNFDLDNFPEQKTYLENSMSECVLRGTFPIEDMRAFNVEHKLIIIQNVDGKLVHWVQDDE